jgi:hypothetical protein
MKDEIAAASRCFYAMNNMLSKRYVSMSKKKKILRKICGPKYGENMCGE